MGHGASPENSAVRILEKRYIAKSYTLSEGILMVREELSKSQNVNFTRECNEEVVGGEIYGSGVRDKSVPRHWDCWEPLPLPRYAIVCRSMV